MRRTALVSSLLVALSCACSAAAPGTGDSVRHPLTMDDFFAIQRISSMEVSPDGKYVAYVVARADFEKNRVVEHVWILPPGGAPHRLTAWETQESAPCWSPDSRHVAFIAACKGKPQVWRAPVEGGEPRQVTGISTGAAAVRWSPDGRHIAFLSRVFPGLPPGDAEQKKRQEAIDASGVQAQVIDHLLYRHWSSWRGGRRVHLFLAPAEGGEARDLTRGESDVVGGARGYAFSPDGKELAFTRSPVRPENGSSADVEAWSTNADICLVPASGGETVCLTRKNPGWDGTPVWSPDGRWIAFRSQANDGYESDKFRLAVLERSTGNINYDVSAELDRDVDEILWAPDSRRVYTSVEDNGRTALFVFSLDGLKAASRPVRILSGRQFTHLSIPSSGTFIVGSSQSLIRPAEVAVLPGLSRQNGPRRLLVLTHHNDAILENVDMPSVRSVRYPGAGDTEIQAWVLEPPGARKGAKSPFVLFIHGGPQGAWNDTFHFRWNLALFAARGFTIMAPNPRGSTGFGRELTAEISGDWAGACYEDILKATDWAVAKGLADPGRMAAMGGSFGGYMVNWLLGHTNRFQALISHAGVYNLDSMYGATEELWFPEWDLRGTPWKNTGCYEKFSPHRFAANFRTPTLVIHGQLDFRVPVTEGMQLFTALKRQGVEARFLYYPDEGHWVLKPRNSRLWVQTCFDWIEKHIGRGP